MGSNGTIVAIFGTDAEGGTWLLDPNSETEYATRLDDDDPLAGTTTLILPDTEEWKVLLDPSRASAARLDATEGRVVTWNGDAPTITALPPIDFQGFEVFQHFPPGYSPKGFNIDLDFVFHLFGGVHLLASWKWRDGAIVEVGGRRDEITPIHHQEIHAPMATVLKYRARNCSIYDVLGEDSDIYADPEIVQYLAGYFESSAFDAAHQSHQLTAGATLMAFLEGLNTMIDARDGGEVHASA